MNTDMPEPTEPKLGSNSSSMEIGSVSNKGPNPTVIYLFLFLPTKEPNCFNLPMTKGRGGATSGSKPTRFATPKQQIYSAVYSNSKFLFFIF